MLALLLANPGTASARGAIPDHFQPDIGLLGGLREVLLQTATQLEFSQEPTNTTPGGVISPAVTVVAEDDNWDVVTTYSGTITVAIETNPGDGTLSGTLSAAAVNGVATFDDLSIDTLGTRYTLSVTADGLTGAISLEFDVTEVAGVSESPGDSYEPSLVLDGSGTPAVAWLDDTGGNLETYVKYWDASAWADYGGSGSGGGVSANAGYSYYPSLALEDSGNPVVAWWDNTSGNYEIYVRRWDGSAWTELGGSAISGGVSANAGYSGYPSLALDDSGNPVLAWEDNTSGNNEIYVKRWDGSAWVDIGTGSSSGGGISATPGASLWSSLKLDVSEHPVVAWCENTLGNSEIYVKRWDGSAWVDIGTGSSSGGGISSNAGASYAPSLALDTSGNPVVAWWDATNGNYEIYVKRWDGSAWVEVGTASASGGGISANGGTSSWPSLAVDASENPVLAWQDNSSGNNEIYVQHWNGSAWVDYGGSGSAGGVSADAESSEAPSLVLDALGNPVVAWSDNTIGNYEIYVTHWDGMAWTSTFNTGASEEDDATSSGAMSTRDSRCIGSMRSAGSSAGLAALLGIFLAGILLRRH